MSFVPVVTPPPPSPRAKALGEKIRVVIQEHCREEPATTSVDVQQALRLAAAARGGTRMLRTAVILGIGLLVLGLLLFVFLSRAF